jgi:apolipoprotein N-acyltransferase
MNSPTPSRHERILKAGPEEAPEPTSPFTEAVAAYRAERRKGLRLLGLVASLALVATALSIAYLGRWSASAPPGPAQLAITPPALPETEKNFQRLLSENLMLKEQLRKAEAMNEDLQSLILRESKQTIAEENRSPGEPRPHLKTAPASETGRPELPPASGTGSATTSRPAPHVRAPTA